VVNVAIASSALLSERPDAAATRQFFGQALRHGPVPVEVTTDKAPAYLRVLDEFVPAALHVTEPYGPFGVERGGGDAPVTVASG